MREFRAVIVVTWQADRMSDATQEIEGAVDDLAHGNPDKAVDWHVCSVTDVSRPPLPTPPEPVPGMHHAIAGSGA